MTLLYEVTKGPTKDLQISHEGTSTEMQKSNRGPTTKVESYSILDGVVFLDGSIMCIHVHHG